MILENILAQVVPAMIATIVAQKAPDEIIPISKEPSSIPQSMTLVGAIVIILVAVESIQAQRFGEINPEQLAAAFAIVWGMLPRAHQIIDAVAGLWAKH